MKAELKAKWLTALRSGDYKQGMGSLFEAGAYCCLGVLCDIGAENKYKTENHDDEFAFDWFDDKYMTCVLTPGVLENLGMTKEQQDRLVSMNDAMGDFMGKQQSFSEIADWIEENIHVES